MDGHRWGPEPCSVTANLLSPVHCAWEGARATCTYPGPCAVSARSHEAILRIPNELFYDSELKACERSELDVRNTYCAWEELPKKVRGAPGRGPGRIPKPKVEQSPTLSIPRDSPSSSTGFVGKTGGRPRVPRSSTQPRSRSWLATSGSCCRVGAREASPASHPRRLASSPPTGSR